MSSAALVFEKAKNAFASAFEQRGQETRFRLAQHTIALKFIGPVLAEKLLPVFSHLEPAGDRDADLTICCWDDASSGISWEEPETARNSAQVDYVDGAVRLAWAPEERNFQALDTVRKIGLYRIADADALPIWEESGPFRRILHWWAAGLGFLFLHGAAVATAHGGVVLVGASGSGKSTTALACVGTMLRYAADDYCLIEPEPKPTVNSIYGSGKADDPSIARLPRLASAFRSAKRDQWDKSVISIADHFPSAIIRSFPLRAVVAPRIVSGEDCHAEALSPAECLRLMAPSTLFQLPGDRQTSMRIMAMLVRTLPCYKLYMGNDPSMAQTVLEKLSAGGFK